MNTSYKILKHTRGDFPFLLGTSSSGSPGSEGTQTKLECERAWSTEKTRAPPKNAQHKHKAAKTKTGFTYKGAHSDKDEEPVHDH